MNVLLISTNNFQEPARVLPIGISYISKALKNAGIKVAFLDMAWIDDVEEAIKGTVLKEKPDLVGLGIRNTDDYISNPPDLLLPLIRDTVDFLKAAGIDEEKIVAGGTAVSIFKESLLQYIGVKYGCIGEGENFFLEFAECIMAGRDFKHIRGLIYLEKGVYRINPPKRLEADEIGEPDFDIYDTRYLTEPNKYGLKASLSVQTKRGCIYNCVYCAAPSIEGNKIVCRDPEKVVDEMTLITEKFGDYEIEILDNDFNMPPEHGEAICRELIKRNLKIRWNCGIHPGFITKEFLELLKRANCQRVDIGMESASERMLRNLNRTSYSSQHLIEIANWCNELDIDTFLIGCIGGPGESFYTLKETFQTIERMGLINKKGLPTTIFNGGLRIYPGSDLVKLAIDEGIIWNGHPLLFPVFYFSKGMDGKAYKLLMEYRGKHPEWLFKGTVMDEWLNLHKRLTNNSNQFQKIEQTKIENECVGKDVSKKCFFDIKDYEIRTDCYKGRKVVFVIAWQQNNEDAKKWIIALRKRYPDREKTIIQGIGSIPPLPNFLTRDFIKNQLEIVQREIGTIWLDWDSKFIKELNLTLGKRTIIIGVDDSCIIRFKQEEFFNESSVKDISGKIDTLLTKCI